LNVFGIYIVIFTFIGRLGQRWTVNVPAISKEKKEYCLKFCNW